MKRLYITSVLIALTTFLFGQSIVTIQVLGDYAEPLVGVTVRNLTKNTGAITYVDGSVKIKASPSDILQFSFTGCETVEFPVYEITAGMGNKVVLISNAVLPEVVVTASKYPLVRQDPYDWQYYADTLQINFHRSWSYYPNPTIYGVKVETPEMNGFISIYAMDGSVIGQTTVSGVLTNVDMSALPAATYLLFYENDDWSSPVGKVVLNKL